MPFTYSVQVCCLSLPPLTQTCCHDRFWCQLPTNPGDHKSGGGAFCLTLTLQVPASSSRKIASLPKVPPGGAGASTWLNLKLVNSPSVQLGSSLIIFRAPLG